MNFVHGILGLVDDVWSLWTIPAYIIFGYILTIHFPIIGLFLLFIFISMDNRAIGYFNNVIMAHNTKSDNKYEHTYDQAIIDQYKREIRGKQLNIIIMILITVIAVVIAVYLTLHSQFQMCENTDVLPYSLVDILRKLIHPSCV